MIFMSLLLALVSGSCLEASSHTSSTVGPAAYTTITNTIDIMGAVESAQENNGGGYGGQIDYSINGNAKTMSRPKGSNADYHRLESPDVSNAPKTLSLNVEKLQELPKALGISTIVVRSGPSFSYVTSFAAGPSISVVKSTGPDIHTISYSAPGRVFISHGSPAASSIIPPEGINSAHYSGVDNIPELAISEGGLNSSSLIHPVTARPAAAIVYNSVYTGYVGLGHPAQAAVSRNLESARQIIARIPSTVSHALNNLSGIRLYVP